MGYLRSRVTTLLATGRVSKTTYQLLTGLALLVTGSLLWTARFDDGAAGPVALVLVVASLVTFRSAARERRQRTSGQA